jgi:hypothetical protein
MTELASRVVGVMAVCLLMSGCGFFGTASLHTDPTRLGGCSLGVGRDATVHGSAADPRLAWAIETASGKRVELVWPKGYTARFSPELEVLDRDGQVVAHEGDLIVGSCLSKDDEPRLDPGRPGRHQGSGLAAPRWLSRP